MEDLNLVLYSANMKLSREVFKNPSLNDEDIFRDLIRKLVTDIPLGDLKKIIKLTKIDPFSLEFEKIHNNVTGAEKEYLKHIERTAVIEFKVEIIL